MRARNHREGSGIVYCLSRGDTEDVAAQIRQYTDVTAAHYHAGLTPKQRMTVQNDWRSGKVQVGRAGGQGAGRVGRAPSRTCGGADVMGGVASCLLAHPLLLHLCCCCFCPRRSSWQPSPLAWVRSGCRIPPLHPSPAPALLPAQNATSPAPPRLTAAVPLPVPPPPPAPPRPPRRRGQGGCALRHPLHALQGDGGVLPGGCCRAPRRL